MAQLYIYSCSDLFSTSTIKSLPSRSVHSGGSDRQQIPTIQELVPWKRASKHLTKGIRIKYKKWLKAGQSKACTKALRWETAAKKCPKGKGEERVAREL